ncbi:YppE family protein [Siminovitchia sediminis]|uniref:YppE family protein n=1 Tax=Siminovitchia sediminis TaxID=1274353 RepID=A0ABW4KGK4_9BACI
MEYEQLKDLTCQLLKLNRQAAKVYQRCRETGEKGDFYTQVKPFADQVKELSEKWEQEAMLWVHTVKPDNLFPIQIKNTSENLQMVSVRAFFPDTSFKRFTNHVRSVEFILERVLENITGKPPGAH